MIQLGTDHDHSSGHGSGGGERSIRKLGVVALINLGGFVIELAGGLLFGSVALIGDAFHMLFDALAYVLAFGAAYISRRAKPGEYWSYGLDRIEPFTAFLNGILLVPMVGYLVWESYQRFLNPVEIDPLMTAGLATGGLLVNFASVYYLQGGEMNLNEKGAYYHLIGDTGASVAVIVSMLVVEFTGSTIADPITAVLIAVIIIWSAVKLLRESGEIFFQRSPVSVDEVETRLKEIEGIVEPRKVETSDSMPPSLHLDVDEFVARVEDGTLIDDPWSDEWMADALESWGTYIEEMPTAARQEYGGTVYTLSAVCPLFAVGAFLSFERIFELLYDDPAVIHQALEFHTANLVTWVEAVESVFEDAGIAPPKFQLPTEILPMLSPEHAREFCLPYYRRIFEASDSAIKVFHCDNHVTPMADVVGELGANIYRGNFCDYATLRDRLSDDVAIMGNVPPVRVLTNGTPEDVAACGRWLIGECAPGGGFILSAGGSFDLRGQTSDENIEAMVECAERFGSYPITVEPGTVPSVYRSFVTASFPMESDHRADDGSAAVRTSVAAAVRDGDRDAVRKHLQDALQAGDSRDEPVAELRGGLVAAEHYYWAEEYYYPELLRSDRAYEAGLAELGGLEDLTNGTAVIGSLRSIFESGNIVVRTILHAAGLEVVDLGANVSPEEFVEEAAAVDADLVAMGVYMPRNFGHVQDVERLRQEEGRDFRTVAGGVGIGYAPAGEEFAVDATVVDTSTLRETVNGLLAG